MFFGFAIMRPQLSAAFCNIGTAVWIRISIWMDSLKLSPTRILRRTFCLVSMRAIWLLCALSEKPPTPQPPTPDSSTGCHFLCKSTLLPLHCRIIPRFAARTHARDRSRKSQMNRRNNWLNRLSATHTLPLKSQTSGGRLAVNSLPTEEKKKSGTLNRICFMRRP